MDASGSIANRSLSLKDFMIMHKLCLGGTFVNFEPRLSVAEEQTPLHLNVPVTCD